MTFRRRTTCHCEKCRSERQWVRAKTSSLLDRYRSMNWCKQARGVKSELTSNNRAPEESSTTGPVPNDHATRDRAPATRSRPS